MDSTRAPLGALLVALVTGWFSHPASAFVDPPTFSPPEPISGQPFTFAVRAGACHGFGPPPPGIGFEFIEIERDNELVDIIITGVSETDPLHCNIPVATLAADFGSLPEGSYTVRVRIREVFFPFQILPPIAETGLVVRGISAVQVPSASLIGLVSLALLLLIVALKHRRGAVSSMIVLAAITMLALSSKPTHAQEPLPIILVEIETLPGAPSPETIVEGYDFSGGLPPPLEGLEAENPLGAYYFIPHPFRARGDFLQYLDENPELPRARLEQMIGVYYPEERRGSCLVSCMDRALT